MVEESLLSHEMAWHLILAAKSLFLKDSGIWLLHHSAFYLGQIPNVAQLVRFE
jgi:hypothetical protein